MSSYQVIARKYRPQRFSDVVGQEHVTQTLSHAIGTGRIAHAYLFCGPRGTGKTTIARIFAKCLNATGGPKVDFAEDDPKCREIAEGRSLDVLEIDGASNRGIDEIRDLRDTVKYAPATSKYKIYIIDEVHMLTKEAFNALLKTLEEPPEHVKFMFATTEPEKVLPTILSRCQRFDLRRIPIKLIADHLHHIAQQENVKIDDAALFAIARGADGGMRDAESALDQLISFCGENIVESDVLSMFGLTSQSQLLALGDALLKGEASAVLREFNELTRHGKDLGKFVSDLLQHLRNVLIYGISRGDTRLLELSEAEAAGLAAQAKLVSTDGLTRMMEVLTQAEAGLRDAASRKIYIEISLIRAIDARNSVSIDTVLKKLNDMRGEAGGGSASPTAATAPIAPAPSVRAAAPTPVASAPKPVPAAPAPAPAPAPIVRPIVSAAAPTPAPAAPPPAPAASVAAVEGNAQEIWPRLLDALGQASRFVFSYFMEAHPVSFVKNMFTIGFDPELEEQRSMVDNAKNQALIAAKLAELGFPNCHVKIIKSPRPDGYVPPAPPAMPEPAPRPAAANHQEQATAPEVSPQAEAPKPAAKPVQLDPAEFKNDPLIKKALEIFKGTIVEVRSA